ncbi:hypothetical protein A1Q2_05707 [Trichosporon asahii var. asahii CBS 8904]|uniref:Uncharacterized protein n=1 Tax=Trichosporon asahii var. asahii (strain CBS 8904) TaxID=1220162 RepID=K1VTG9_TRIAC|nr:hypothetical protein A1Q2_05707 [Trichosporon asahii var. asahii CBS 8904]
MVDYTPAPVHNQNNTSNSAATQVPRLRDNLEFLNEDVIATTSDGVPLHPRDARFMVKTEPNTPPRPVQAAPIEPNIKMEPDLDGQVRFAHLHPVAGAPDVALPRVRGHVTALAEPDLDGQVGFAHLHPVAGAPDVALHRAATPLAAHAEPALAGEPGIPQLDHAAAAARAAVPRVATPLADHAEPALAGEPGIPQLDPAGAAARPAVPRIPAHVGALATLGAPGRLASPALLPVNFQEPGNHIDNPIVLDSAPSSRAPSPVQPANVQEQLAQLHERNLQLQAELAQERHWSTVADRRIQRDRRIIRNVRKALQ